MPTYTFKNRETDEVITRLMSVSERGEFLENNPDYFQPPCTPTFGDAMRLGVTKTSEGFQDILRNAKKFTKDSTIQTRR